MSISQILPPSPISPEVAIDYRLVALNEHMISQVALGYVKKVSEKCLPTTPISPKCEEEPEKPLIQYKADLVAEDEVRPYIFVSGIIGDQAIFPDNISIVSPGLVMHQIQEVVSNIFDIKDRRDVDLMNLTLFSTPNWEDFEFCRGKDKTEQYVFTFFNRPSYDMGALLCMESKGLLLDQGYHILHTINGSKHIFSVGDINNMKNDAWKEILSVFYRSSFTFFERCSSKDEIVQKFEKIHVHAISRITKRKHDERNVVGVLIDNG